MGVVSGKIRAEQFCPPLKGKYFFRSRVEVPRQGIRSAPTFLILEVRTRMCQLRTVCV